MLTRERLRNKVIEWRDMNHNNASIDSVLRLCESLEDEIIEIAREAHQRGLEGKVF